MSNDTRPLSESDRAFKRAACELLGLDPAIVQDDLVVEADIDQNVGKVSLTAHLPLDSVLPLIEQRWQASATTKPPPTRR